MKLKPLVIALVVIGVSGALGAGSYGLYMSGMKHGMGMNAPAAEAGSTGAASGPTAVGKVPQSIAEGEEATRRHIQSGIKAEIGRAHV